MLTQSREHGTRSEVHSATINIDCHDSNFTVITPKGFNIEAQGRVSRTLGLIDHQDTTPKALHQLWNPFGVQ